MYFGGASALSWLCGSARLPVPNTALSRRKLFSILPHQVCVTERVRDDGGYSYARVSRGAAPLLPHDQALAPTAVPAQLPLVHLDASPDTTGPAEPARRNPAFLFSLENPGGEGKMQHAPKIKQVFEVPEAEGGLGAKRCDVTYCMFERGVKKPTHLWTNSKARPAPSARRRPATSPCA